VRQVRLSVLRVHGREDVKRQALNVFRCGCWGRGAAGRVGHAHAQGRHQRGDARLGDERARHALHHRQRGRPAPVSRPWCGISKA
jgi:hypothetical protein